MAPFIKKRSNFLMWVLLPSLLLVVSVFGVNLVSRPGLTGIGCSVVADCNSQDPNPCRLYQCINGACIPAGIDTTQPACAICEACGNGICEPGSPAGDEIFNPSSAQGPTCSLDCGPAALLRCAEDSFTGFPFPCSPTKDFCCPSKCQGSNSNDSLTFDADCCQNICGDGLIDQPTETCDGTVVKPGLTPPTGGNTCRAPGTAGECTYCGDGNVDAGAGEQCDPPNGTTCDSTCKTIVPSPVCGNGIVEGTEQCEGTTCSVTNTDGTIVPGICQNCQCIPQCVVEGSGCGDTGNTEAPCVSGTTTTAGGSLMPLPVHTTVLAQWLAAFAVPGVVFTGLRLRRRK